MEFKYSVSKQDYIDFNLNYFNNNAVVQRSIWMMRVATAVIVIIGGSVLMYWLHALTLVSGLVYLALAAVCFFGTPWYMRRKVVKKHRAHPQKRQQQAALRPQDSLTCAMKTSSSRGRTKTAFTAMTQYSVLHPMTGTTSFSSTSFPPSSSPSRRSPPWMTSVPFMNVSQRTSLTQHSNAEPFFPFPLSSAAASVLCKRLRKRG